MSSHSTMPTYTTRRIGTSAQCASSCGGSTSTPTSPIIDPTNPTAPRTRIPSSSAGTPTSCLVPGSWWVATRARSTARQAIISGLRPIRANDLPKAHPPRPNPHPAQPITWHTPFSLMATSANYTPLRSGTRLDNEMRYRGQRTRRPITMSTPREHHVDTVAQSAPYKRGNRPGH